MMIDGKGIKRCEMDLWNLYWGKEGMWWFGFDLI
jgi:hypothetical protein